jgi:hypothetical protein
VRLYAQLGLARSGKRHGWVQGVSDMAGSANVHVIRLTVIGSVTVITYIVKESAAPAAADGGIHWMTIFVNTLLGLGALGGLATVALLVYAVIDHKRKPVQKAADRADTPAANRTASPHR